MPKGKKKAAVRAPRPIKGYLRMCGKQFAGFTKDKPAVEHLCPDCVIYPAVIEVAK